MKKNIIFLISIIFLIVFSTLVIAVPTNPDILKLKQPDGSNFKARQFGDERVSWIETLDDYTIIQNKERWWVYAKKEKSQILPTEYKVGKVNPKELGLVKSINPELSRTPVEGIEKSSVIKSESPASTEEIITILIQFSDVSFFPGSTSYWHLDTYNAYGGSGYSWWCGADESSWATEPGYGNNWDERLIHEIGLTSATGTITLSFMHKYDMEGTYDFGYVDVYADGSWTTKKSYTNTGGWPGNPVDWTSESLDLSSYAGKIIKIRFRFISDSTWSDEDGSYNSDGAWYIDNLEITDSGGVIFSDDMESGVGDWTTTETSAHDQSYYDNLIFSQTNPESMYSYYKEVSYDQLYINGIISPIVTSSQTMADYGADGPPNRCGQIDGRNGCIYELTREAVQLADFYIDFSQYDKDNNGVVDHVIIVHAGNGQESSGASNDIWSHAWYIDACSDPGGSTCGEQVDGVEVEKYTMLAENSPVGTFAHEFAHDLGLPDLYNTATGGGVVGKWELMDQGSWNNNGNTPAHLSAWSKEKLNWLSFTNVNNIGMSVLVNQLETNAEAFKLVNSILTTSNEFFLVENRQQTGFDAYLPEAGILIWHVDEDYSNNNGAIKMIIPEMPGGSLNTVAYSSNDGQTTFDSSSTPNSNTNDGTANSASVTNIGAESSAMQADFFGGGEFISITLTSGTPITFEGMDAGTTKNATNDPLIVNVDSNVNFDITTKANDEDFISGTDTFPVSNMEWGDVGVFPGTDYTISEATVYSNEESGDFNIYHQLTIPTGQYAGSYEVGITITAKKHT